MKKKIVKYYTLPWYYNNMKRNFCYYDKRLKLWFYFYWDLNTRREIQGASRFRYRAYENLKKALQKSGYSDIPDKRSFTYYSNISKTLTDYYPNI